MRRSSLAEAQDGVVVSLRQRQKQAVPPHQAQRDGGFAEGQAFAALESPNGLHLGLAEIARGENLLLDRVPASTGTTSDSAGRFELMFIYSNSRKIAASAAADAAHNRCGPQ